MSNISGLRSHGFLTEVYSYDEVAGRSLFDLEEKQKVKEKAAYCSSQYCIKKAGMQKSNYAERAIGAKKENVPKGEWFCPDCGYALFWGIHKWNKKVK